MATLKPSIVGVPDYRDTTREYLEIAVLQMQLRPGARAQRLVELVHRAVPYPVLLACDTDAHTHLSVVHKRWSAGEAAKTVIDGEVVGVEVANTDQRDVIDAFLRAMAVNALPRASAASSPATPSPTARISRCG